MFRCIFLCTQWDTLQVSCCLNLTCKIFSLLIVYFFSRNYGYFLLKTYIPSCIIVLTAIFGFWLASAAYPQRIALYMSAMIALFTMQVSYQFAFSSKIKRIYKNNDCLPTDSEHFYHKTVLHCVHSNLDDQVCIKNNFDDECNDNHFN